MTGANGGVRRPAGGVVIGGIIALSLMATAAVLFITGDAASQRLALLLGVLSPTIVALVGALRSDTAAARLDGSFDERVTASVHRAIAARRNGDAIPETPPVVKATPLEGEK